MLFESKLATLLETWDYNYNKTYGAKPGFKHKTTAEIEALSPEERQEYDAQLAEYEKSLSAYDKKDTSFRELDADKYAALSPDEQAAYDRDKATYEKNVAKQQATINALQTSKQWGDPAPVAVSDSSIEGREDRPAGATAIVNGYFVDADGVPLAEADPQPQKKPIPSSKQAILQRIFDIRTTSNRLRSQYVRGRTRIKRFYKDLPEFKALQSELGELLSAYEQISDSEAEDRYQQKKSAPVIEPAAPEPTERFRDPTKGTISNDGRVIAADLQDLTPGFYVVSDRAPDVALDGPFQEEMEAQVAMHSVIKQMTQEKIDDMRSSGETLTHTDYDRLVKDMSGEISYRFIDPKAEGTATKEKGRRYEFGEMREKQLEMLAQGKIESVEDLNPNQDYLDSPRLENLKLVKCPLILDKANPPRKPWTLKQVMTAMYPIVQNQVKKWVGHGFSEDEAIEVAYVSIMKSLLNDRGMSPFPGYASFNIWGDLNRAKKTSGIIRRPVRAEGWGTQGVTSASTPLMGADGGEAGSIEDTFSSGANGSEKITCPTCGGSKFDPMDTEGTECNFCNGTGVNGVDKEGNPKTCRFCKGTRKIRDTCPGCGGTGNIVLTAAADLGPTSYGKHGTKDLPTLDIQSPLDVTQDEDGNYSVDGDISPDEKVAIQERLTRAHRLVTKLMDAAKLTPTQQLLLSLRFGLPVMEPLSKMPALERDKWANAITTRFIPHGDKDGRDAILRDASAFINQNGREPNVNSTDEREKSLAREMNKFRVYQVGSPLSTVDIEKMSAAGGAGATGKGVSKERVSQAVESSIKNIRNAVLNTKDEDLFDWFLQYQKEYGLSDLSDMFDPKVMFYCPKCDFKTAPNVGVSQAKQRAVHLMDTGHEMIATSKQAVDGKFADAVDPEQAMKMFTDPDAPWWIRNNRDMRDKFEKEMKTKAGFQKLSPEQEEALKKERRATWAALRPRRRHQPEQEYFPWHDKNDKLRDPLSPPAPHEWGRGLIPKPDPNDPLDEGLMPSIRAQIMEVCDIMMLANSVMILTEDILDYDVAVSMLKS